MGYTSICVIYISRSTIVSYFGNYFPTPKWNNVRSLRTIGVSYDSVLIGSGIYPFKAPSCSTTTANYPSEPLVSQQTCLWLPTTHQSSQIKLQITKVTIKTETNQNYIILRPQSDIWSMWSVFILIYYFANKSS